jgi:hypothetical protein
MQEVDYPVLAPSVCVVCEGVPPATAFVDTLRTFDPGGYTHLNGRKYLCESCVTEAANALGLSDEAVAPVQAQVDELTAKVVQLEGDIENYQTVQAAIESLTARPVVQIEDKVAEAVETAKSRKSARSKSAADAQETIDAQKAAEAEGAARQAEIDQAAADLQQAASEAAVNPVEEPVVEEPVVEEPPADGAPAEAGNPAA